MSNFNYQEYLRNNPLLQEEVKDQLITESLPDRTFKEDLEEVELPTSTLTKVNSEVEDYPTMAQAMLDFFNQVKEKEATKFESNAMMKIVLDKLNKLAKNESQDIEETVEDSVSEDTRTDAEQEGYKDGFNDAKDDVKDTLSKMKVSELKAKIKEDIISLLNEEEEEDVDVDIEDEVEIDAEEPTIKSSPDAGLSSDEQEIQDSLKLAYDNAVAIGDQKLADQIGNSITFFTRTHVVER